MKQHKSLSEKIIVLFCYSRSGGTLLSQLLNSNKNIFLLSEIGADLSVSIDHKIRPSCEVIKEQLNKWHNLKVSGESINEIITSVYSNECFKKNIIFRDWSVINFNPSKFNDYSPTFQMELLKHLEIKYDVQKIALIRDSIDVCLSMHADPEEFSYYYDLYLEVLNNMDIKIYKYEDLVSNASSFLNKLSEDLGIKNNYDLNNYKIYPATGDNKYKYLSRGQRSKSIIKQKRRRVSNDLIKKINNCQKIKEINKRNNYPTNYYDCPLESRKELFIDKLYRTYHRFLKK